jgi:hypothetical protein
MQDMNVMCDLEGPSDLLLFNAATETLLVIGKKEKEKEQSRSSAPAKGGRGAGAMARYQLLSEHWALGEGATDPKPAVLKRHIDFHFSLGGCKGTCLKHAHMTDCRPVRSEFST